MMRFLQKLPGLLLCIAIGYIAIQIRPFLPFGTVAVAILLGIIIRNTIRIHEKFNDGINFSESTLLSLAVAFMGVDLNYLILQELGLKTFILIIVTIMFTFFISFLIAKMMKWNTKKALLITIGNSICGTSAIAASEKIIDAEEDDVGISIALINFLGTIGMFLLPFLSTYYLNLDEVDSGILIGNVLQSVGNVTAGAFSISATSGQTAVIVKMARILMLTPLLLILVFVYANKNKYINDPSSGIKAFNFPIFILAFVIFSLISSFNLLSEDLIAQISQASRYLLVIAMVAIGMKISLNVILRDGKKALMYGGLVFLMQLIFSSVIIKFIF